MALFPNTVVSLWPTLWENFWPFADNFVDRALEDIGKDLLTVGTLLVFQEFTEFYQLDEMFSYITDYMKLHGPYDGLLGFSQVQNGVVFIYLLPIESATIEICIATTFDLFHVISCIFRFQQSMTS